MSYFTKIQKTGAFIIRICLGAFLLSGCVGAVKPNSPISSTNNQEPLKIRENMWDTNDLKPNHLVLAEDLMAKGFYGVALVQLDLAMEKDKNNPHIYNLRGVCARETKDFKGAAKFFKKALVLDKKNAPAHNNLGILYSMEAKSDLAEKNFNKALGLDPGRADFFNNLGVLYMQKKEYAKAENCFKQAIQLVPKHGSAINNLAITLGYLHKYDRAMELLLTRNPYKTACHNMGCIYEMTGENEKAKKMFDLAGAENNNIDDNDQIPFDTQILNPRAPLDTTPPMGISGNSGNAIYKRYQSKIKAGKK